MVEKFELKKSLVLLAVIFLCSLISFKAGYAQCECDYGVALSLRADPDSIPADGKTRSTLEATIGQVCGPPPGPSCIGCPTPWVSNPRGTLCFTPFPGTGTPITFRTTLGILCDLEGNCGNPITVVTGEDGRAFATLTSEEPGTATVCAEAEGFPASCTTVEVRGDPDPCGCFGLCCKSYACYICCLPRECCLRGRCNYEPPV